MTDFKIYADNELIDGDILASATAETLGQTAPLYAEIVTVDQEEIRKLNRENRAVDAVTDVLSFPMLDGIRGKKIDPAEHKEDFDEDEGRIFLGSVAICEARAREQAEEYGHGLKREMNYLAVHGLLHLFGFDHMEESDKKEMREAEEKILEKIGATRNV